MRFLDEDKLKSLSLIVPVWTMGKITNEQLKPVLNAVESGVGLAGCHGGMCDSFRDATEWQWMTGGQWVSHPGNDGVEYPVRITNPDHFITQGAPREFQVKSEQYYLHTDPSNVTLAVTPFPIADGPHAPNGPFDMPVIWTRLWGQGRVAYNSLGHHADVVAQPAVLSPDDPGDAVGRPCRRCRVKSHLEFCYALPSPCPPGTYPSGDCFRLRRLRPSLPCARLAAPCLSETSCCRQTCRHSASLSHSARLDIDL